MKDLVRFFLLIQVFGLASAVCKAQNALPPQITIRQTLEGISDPGGITRGEVLYGVESQPGRLLGDYYLDPKWNKGSIMIYGSDKILDGYFVKYDIEGNSLEVLVGNIIKLISINRIQSLIWHDSLTSVPRAFVNGKNYSENGVPLTGLIEVLEDGQIPLVKRTFIWIKQPDYVIAFDVGSKDAKIYKREHLYYLDGNQLIPIKNKKTLLIAFKESGEEMERYIKLNKLNIKDERGLRALFKHYNAAITEASN